MEWVAMLTTYTSHRGEHSMANADPDARRLIPIEADLAGPFQPQRPSVRRRQIDDYARLSPAYREVVQNYANPLLAGPPICDELVALVQHMFTEEEASLARHIKTPLGRTAASVAAAAGRPVDEVDSILDSLAHDKFILFAFGSEQKRRYSLMPLLPGVFEMALIRTSLDSLTDWHRRLAKLFLALYDTGYFVDYVERPIPGVRYVPVGEAIDAHPQALPSDRLEEVLDRYHVFGVGLCQCRMSSQIVDRACDRPLENCIGFGDAAEYLIRHGKMRPVDRSEVLDIKREATAAGLVSFVTEIDVGRSRSGASCSCCGCCCGGLRLIRDFNAPGLIAPPHFVPQVDLTSCIYCGRCAAACPTRAIVVDAQARLHQHLLERCIGCGLCAVNCGQQGAIRMEPVPGYRQPPQSLLSSLVRLGPNYLRNAWSVWHKYR
jgi:electron transport complex protein RnfB